MRTAPRKFGHRLGGVVPFACVLTGISAACRECHAVRTSSTAPALVAPGTCAGPSGNRHVSTSALGARGVATVHCDVPTASVILFRTTGGKNHMRAVAGLTHAHSDADASSTSGFSGSRGYGDVSTLRESRACRQRDVATLALLCSRAFKLGAAALSRSGSRRDPNLAATAVA